MSEIAFVAVDWGTTSFRLWGLTDGGTVAGATHSNLGMSKLKRSDFSTVLEENLDRLGIGPGVPVVICGMAGAAQGWCEAPYLCAPTKLDNFGRHAVVVRDTARDVRILPGVKQQSPADVMRGEETQILGFMRHHPRFEGVICLPGTHTKWVSIADGELKHFSTCMTGEQFALLSTSSVLSHAMAKDGWDDDAFIKTIRSIVDKTQDVAGQFFRLRAESLLEGIGSAEARARLSGLLIGMELAAMRRYWEGRTVHLVGAEKLSCKYADALKTQGVATQIHDCDLMTLTGLTAAYETQLEARR